MHTISYVDLRCRKIKIALNIRYCKKQTTLYVHSEDLRHRIQSAPTTSYTTWIDKPTMSHVFWNVKHRIHHAFYGTYDIVRLSYDIVRYTYDVDKRTMSYVQCRTLYCTYDIIRTMLSTTSYVWRTMSFVLRTTSYVDVRHPGCTCAYSYVNLNALYDVQCMYLVISANVSTGQYILSLIITDHSQK